MHNAQTLPISRHNQRLRDLFIVLGTSILFALSSWISIRLPFTPVPISFTCQLILMASVFLGRRGTYATFAYLGQGLMGLPIFASGGAGLAYLFGPTGGYLIGFAIASYVVGTFSEQMKDRTSGKTLLLMLTGNLMVYLFGVPHLALLIGWQKALLLGFTPFIGADVIKVMFALKGLKLIEKK